MGKRVNDGTKTGLKQDKYRNSRFEFEPQDDPNRFGGVSRSTPNTIGGVWAENRGRRTTDDPRSQWSGSPYENGDLENWNRREGWDRYYRDYDREGNRAWGGAQLHHEAGGAHVGKGPRGYKRADDSINEDVCDALSLNPDVDASEVEVRVEEGIVYLKGTVSDRRAKKLAEYAIENISGVKDVLNQLSVKEGKGYH